MSHAGRSAYAVALGVEWVCRNGSKPIMATLTFKENITDKAEAAKRWRRLKARLVRKNPWMSGCGVWQRQGRGAWHLHLVLSDGVSVDWLREHAVACGWGTMMKLRWITAWFRSKGEAEWAMDRTSIKGWRTTSDVRKVIRYIVRYITRDEREEEDKGVRVTEYFGGAHVATTAFRWVGGMSRVWRLGRDGWANLYPGRLPRFRDFETVMEIGWASLTEEEQAKILEQSDAVAKWRGLVDEPF